MCSLNSESSVTSVSLFFIRQKTNLKQKIMYLRKDLGYDEVNEDWYGLYILKEDGTIFCQVYGKTTEECDKNAKRVLKTNKHKL